MAQWLQENGGNPDVPDYLQKRFITYDVPGVKFVITMYRTKQIKKVTQSLVPKKIISSGGKKSKHGLLYG